MGAGNCLGTPGTVWQKPEQKLEAGAPLPPSSSSLQETLAPGLSFLVQRKGCGICLLK